MYKIGQTACLEETKASCHGRKKDDECLKPRAVS